MLGVREMSPAKRVDASETGTTADERIAAAVALLERVLDLLDSTEAPAELAARVQEAIDALSEFRK